MSQISGRAGLDETRMIGKRARFTNANATLYVYWAMCLVFGILFLRDDILAWRVPEGLKSNWGWALFALVVTLGSQVGYMIVARSDGRKVAWVSSLTFIIVNGLLEGFVFLGIYTLFFKGAKLIFGDLDFINVFFGIFGFFLYSGFIHAFYWARLIPPHFTAEPKLQTFRRLLTPIQATILIFWCIYYYYTNDVWTVIGLHIIVDSVLMFWVRPPILWAAKQK